MPPTGADLVELLTDPAPARLDACRGRSKVRNPKVNVRRHNRLPGRDSLKGEPWRRPFAEHDVGTLIHRDRLVGQLAIKPAQPIGIVTAQCDVGEVHPPIMSWE